MLRILPSWELDALSPKVLDTLVRAHVAQYRDDDLYEQRVERQQWARELPEEPDADNFNIEDYPIYGEIDESIFNVSFDEETE